MKVSAKKSKRGNIFGFLKLSLLQSNKKFERALCRQNFKQKVCTEKMKGGRAFSLYWGGIRLESLPTHHCWTISKSFIPSLVVWSMTKNKHIWRRKAKTKRATGEQSDLCDLEQIALKPQLQAHHCLTTWLQIWYHSLLWGDSIREGADLEKQNCFVGVHPAVMGKLTFLPSLFKTLF